MLWPVEMTLISLMRSGNYLTRYVLDMYIIVIIMIG